MANNSTVGRGADPASDLTPSEDVCVRCGALLDAMGNPTHHNGQGPYCGAACADLHARGL